MAAGKSNGEIVKSVRQEYGDKTADGLKSRLDYQSALGYAMELKAAGKSNEEIVGLVRRAPKGRSGSGDNGGQLFEKALELWR